MSFGVSKMIELQKYSGELQQFCVAIECIYDGLILTWNR